MFLGGRLLPESFRKYSVYTFGDFVTVQCTFEAKSILIELPIAAYLSFAELLKTSRIVSRLSAVEPVGPGLSSKAFHVAS